MDDHQIAGRRSQLSESNESCDISPEAHEGSLRRRRAYANQVREIGYEEMDKSDLSSMNPLVTPGVEVTERGENRCSLFDANISNQGSAAKRSQR